MKHQTQIQKPTEGPLSSGALFELSLFSTCIFVFAALLMQFLLTLYTALLLNLNSIAFHYSLFAINYSTESALPWPEDQVYFVFGSGPLLLSLLGIVLIRLLKRSLGGVWKIRLSLTWLAFLMVNALPCGIVAGVFFYDGFGMAFQWSATSLIVRGLIALVVLAVLVIFSRYWQRMFLKTCYADVFLEDGERQKIFIKNVFFKPWIYGLLILLLFNWPFDNLYWRAFLFSLGYLAITLFDRNTRMYQKPHISKSDFNSRATRIQILYCVVVLTLIWVADSFIMKF